MTYKKASKTEQECEEIYYYTIKKHVKVDCSCIIKFSHAPTTKNVYNFTTLENTPCRTGSIYNVAHGTLKGSLSKHDVSLDDDVS